jgi:hypothetical protein
MKARKPRNPIARALGSPRFRKRTVRSSKISAADGFRSL